MSLRCCCLLLTRKAWNSGGTGKFKPAAAFAAFAATATDSVADLKVISGKV
jgi:hypothetical protein